MAYLSRMLCKWCGESIKDIMLRIKRQTVVQNKPLIAIMVIVLGFAGTAGALQVLPNNSSNDAPVSTSKTISDRSSKDDEKQSDKTPVTEKASDQTSGTTSQTTQSPSWTNSTTKDNSTAAKTSGTTSSSSTSSSSSDKNTKQASNSDTSNETKPSDNQPSQSSDNDGVCVLNQLACINM